MADEPLADDGEAAQEIGGGHEVKFDITMVVWFEDVVKGGVGIGEEDLVRRKKRYNQYFL